MSRWLLRGALWLVPASWRDAVCSDLDQDARAHGHGAFWRLAQALAVAVRLRGTFGGDTIMSDIRYALRSLLHARWFALGAVLTFALGIGVNVAVFSAVDRMTFRPLPYRDVGRLFVLKEASMDRAQTYGTLPALWVVNGRRQVVGLAGMAMADMFGQGFALTSEPGAESAVGVLPVTFGMLDVLGVSPLRGRAFTEDDARAHRRVVLISYTTWQRSFGGRDDVLQAKLWQAGKPADIIGVLPADFIPPSGGGSQSYGLSLDNELMETATPNDRADPVVVRLAPGATAASVEAAFAPIVADYERQRSPAPAGRTLSHTRAVLQPLGESMFGYYRTYVWVVAGAAGLVLLIACANLASLMLVRGRSRENETAVRVALGASTARIVRSAVFEAVLLSVTGTVVGIGVLAWSNQALRALLPGIFVSYSEAWYDARVLGFSVLAATACALVAGLLPGLRLSKVDVLPILKAVAGRTQAGRLRGGGSLLIVEAAVAVLLVGGAAMTARSLIGLARVDVGFDARDLYSVGVRFPIVQGMAPEANLQRYAGALDVIRESGGIRAAAGADVLPVVGAVGNAFGGGYDGQRWRVTDNFFETMGMKVLAGRTVSRADVADRATVAVLSVRGLNLVWPGVAPREAVGRALEFKDEPALQVIGIVSDVRGGFAQTPYPSIYLPITPERFRFMMYVARVAPGAAPAVPEMRARLRQIGADPASPGTTDISRRLSGSLVDQEFRTALFGAFGVVALLLAAVGLYAVASFDVSQRRREMGVRLTLGAAPRQIQRQVVLDALKPVAVGVVAGLTVAWWAGQFLQSFLHDVDARDPWTLALVAAVLIATAAAAAWGPARRAGGTDPVIALRAQ